MVVGDYNANILKTNSVFSKHLMQYCSMSDYKLSSVSCLPLNTYTYISDAWNTCSWLDHCIATEDGHKLIKNMKVLYNNIISDHFPVSIELDVELAPNVERGGNSSFVSMINWANLKQDILNKYNIDSDHYLKDVEVPAEALVCKNVKCKNSSHVDSIKLYYERILNALRCATRDNIKSYKMSNSKNYNRPGWNEFCDSLYKEAHSALRTWRLNGSPRQGPICNYKNGTRARFKSAMRFIKKNEETLRMEALAQKLTEQNSVEFWKNIKKINRSNVSLPSVIDGVCGTKNIASVWKHHYKSLFNCLRENIDVCSTVEEFTYSRDIDVTNSEIVHTIRSLEKNKSCGLDNIYAEHFIHCSRRLVPLLAMCFSSILVHGVLPDTMISVVLIPVIKNKSKSICDKENYRPIALASIASKILEKILYNRMAEKLYTKNNQFGFKNRHGTDMCIYTLKEAICTYNDMNSNVYSCFLDASKAFDS